MQTQPKAYDGAPTEVQEGSPRSPLEGTPAAAASPVQGTDGSAQVPLLVGALLDRMVETRAPVVRRGTWGHPQDVTIAVVPLNTGRQLEGALCIVRKASPLPSAANGTAAGPAPCPDLLSDPSALMQLGLCVSLALFAGESGQQFRVLCEGLHALSTANSMQQLVGGLCQALEAHVQAQYLLAPRVTAALVPKPGASTGLMFACRGPSELPGTRAAGNEAGSELGNRRYNTAAELPRHNSSAARALKALAVTSSGGSGQGRALSESMPRYIRPHGAAAHCAGRAMGADGPKGPTPLPPPVSPGAASGFRSGRAGLGGQSQVIPLGHAFNALLDLPEAGPNSQAAPALHVKPFPLAHTLLGDLDRRAAAAARSETLVFQAAAQDQKAGAAGQATVAAAPRRPRALVVEDCAAHVQDPRRPSRDVLMLMAGSNQQSLMAGTAARCPSLFASGGIQHAMAPLPMQAPARGLQSLIALLLPCADVQCALGLYVAFPQQLPGALLGRARETLLELLQVASPLVSHKLQYDLAVEVETLTTATPGSYAVVEGGTGSAAVTSDRTAGLYGSTPVNAIMATAEQLLAEFQSTENACDAHACSTRDCLFPVMLGSSGASFLFTSTSVSTRRDLGQTTAPGSTHQMAENACGVKHSMRSQMPTLVASLRSSIGAARADVAAAAAARDTQQASSSPVPGAPRVGRINAPLTSDASALAGIELLSRLGHGGCAVVLMGRMGVMDVAVKMDDEDTATGLARASTANSGNMCPRAALTPSGQKRLGARRALLRNAMELAVMTSLTGHPNVLQVYTTFSNVALVRTQKPDGSVTLKLRPADKANPVAEAALDDDTPPVCDCLVAEWCDRGCLAKALASKAVPGTVVVRPADGSGPPRQVPNYKVIMMTLLDVVLALRHLHSHNLIHRDLKPGNVLLRTSNTDPRGFTAKLADFGFVTLLNEPGDDASNGEPFAIVEEACGTVTHMSPESMEEGARIGPSCDVYSLGILMWDMVAGGTRPYAELQPHMIGGAVAAGVRPAFPRNVPSFYRRLAERCWAADPRERPSIEELVSALNALLAGHGRREH
ncbi:hypothetical protein HYH03_007758 [Edaphochlamys debaryana]|uniref:Protein kinase domain-containing protein n=1 Tax=Edaphochlamys debaryana TaxID=47281 RepID=A0A835Y819_9CHLO|nr:hypothetical protein HYH03_007758 [Edaphochlamys debaryana]|eukprot:KAG2494120.1 hypothetical protein HYH03_007758 [Edaphochlamys debaryana]